MTLKSSPPTAAATISGFACCTFSRIGEKSRVPTGTMISSTTSAPNLPAISRVAFEVLWPQT